MSNSVRGVLKGVMAAALLSLLAGCDQPGPGDDPPVLQLLQGSTVITDTDGYDFGSSPLGVTTAALFTLKNVSSEPVDLQGSITFSNPDFSVQVVLVDVRGKSVRGLSPKDALAPDESVSFNLRFIPSSEGAETATGTLETDKGTFSFTLSGTGVSSGHLDVSYVIGQGEPIPLSQDGTVDFGVLPFDSSLTATITITNNTEGSDDLYLSGLPVSITGDAGFSQNGPDPATPLAPGQGGSTTFDITFDTFALTAGVYNATVTLKTSDGSNQTFTFSVMGEVSPSV